MPTDARVIVRGSLELLPVGAGGVVQCETLLVSGAQSLQADLSVLAVARQFQSLTVLGARRVPPGTWDVQVLSGKTLSGAVKFNRGSFVTFAIGGNP